MAQAYPMPQWGITMEEGTLTKWLIAPGQPVKEGDIVAEVATDKIEVDFESPVDGIVAAHLIEEGVTVECGTDVIVIAADAADLASYQANG